MVDLSVDGYPFVIFEWSLFAVSSIAVTARLYVQLRFRSKPWRELFVIIAWMLYLQYTICDSLNNDWDGHNYSVDWGNVTDAQLAPLWKAAFVNTLSYKPILYACKAALLCLYMDITPRSSKLWYVIIFSWVWIAIGTLFQILSVLLMCHPISRNWKYSQKCEWAEENFWNKSRPLDGTSWAIHISTDVLVYVFPFFILRQLRSLSQSRKRSAYLMFALGFFNIASAIFIFVFQVAVNITYDVPENIWYAMYFFIPFQAGSAVIIICVPYLRRLWGGTKAKDLRPELNTGNMAVHHRAVGAEDLESGGSETQEKTIGDTSDGEGSRSKAIVNEAITEVNERRN